MKRLFCVVLAVLCLGLCGCSKTPTAKAQQRSRYDFSDSSYKYTVNCPECKAQFKLTSRVEAKLCPNCGTKFKITY